MNKKILLITILALLLVMPLGLAVGTAPSSSDTVAYYELENYIDSVGADDFTAPADAPTLATGIISNGYDFDETNNEYLVSDRKTGALSVSLWMNTAFNTPTDTKNRIIIGTISGAGSNNWHLTIARMNGASPGQLVLYTEDGADHCIDAIAINDGNWHFITITIDGTTGTLYVDGNSKGTVTVTNGYTFGTSTNDIILGNDADNDGDGFSGIIDEVAFFDTVLTTSEITYMNNTGSPTSAQQYPFIANFTVSVVDEWSGNAVNGINVSIDGVNYINSTGNSIVTNLLRNDTALYDITISANDYFNKTYSNVNITNILAGTLYQSIINFTGNQIFTNDTLSNVTFYVNSSENTTFHLSEGWHNVTAEKTGYFNKTLEFYVSALDNKTITIENMSNSRLNLTAIDFFSNVSLSNLSGWIYNNDIDENVSFSTTSDAYLKDLIIGNYTVFLKAKDYAISNNNTQNITLTTLTTGNITYELYTARSILINVYNGTGTTLLLQNTTITAVYGLESFVNYTTTGSVYLQLLTPASYELRISSDGFSTATMYVTITNTSTTTINIHLIESADLELQRFLVLDQISSEVGGAIVRLQQEVPGSDGLWITIDEKTTSTDGYVGFYVEKSTSIYYRVIVIYEGVVLLTTEKTLFLPGLDEVITLQINTLGGAEVILYDSTTVSTVWSGANNETITFSWADPNNAISGARLEIWYKDYNVTGIPAELLSNASSASTSGELSYTLPVVNDSAFTIKAYILHPYRSDLVYEAIKIFGTTMTTNQNLGLLLSIIVFLFIAFMTISFKPLFSIILSFSVLAILNAFKLISIPATVITSFIALGIIFFIKIKGGNSP